LPAGNKVSFFLQLAKRQFPLLYPELLQVFEQEESAGVGVGVETAGDVEVGAGEAELT
jgi:hypothetical protein